MGGPGDIRWHFIGHLQRRHAKQLVGKNTGWLEKNLCVHRPFASGM